ncbi:MAG TPA: hypothetical protein DCQ37_05405 [Desulfobacteraceae bacterium]|nr:hypothetical protein [Desulfobacteraceae bacterium]
MPSREAYDDVRNAVRKVLTFPEKSIYSDYMMMSHLERFHFGIQSSHSQIDYFKGITNGSIGI